MSISGYIEKVERHGNDILLHLTEKSGGANSLSVYSPAGKAIMRIQFPHSIPTVGSAIWKEWDSGSSVVIIDPDGTEETYDRCGYVQLITIKQEEGEE